MASWIAQWPAALTTLALIILPGAPTAAFIRAKGVIRLGLAVGVSLGIIAAASLVAPYLGMPWSLVPVLVVAVAVSAVAGALRLMQPTRPKATNQLPERGVWITLGLALVGWIILLTLGIREADHPNQLYDSIFHLNAVEFIREHGTASPIEMTMVAPSAATMFYPTLWHGMVNLLVPSSGSVVTATNVLTVIVVAFVWPVAMAFLTRVLFPHTPSAAVWAPLMGFGFSVFPLGALNWGVLYPHLLGMALAPLLIGTVLLAFSRDLVGYERTLRILAALAAAGATAVAHPSAVFAALTVLVPFALSRVWHHWRRAPSRTVRAVWFSGTVAGMALLVTVWAFANVTTNAWLPSVTMAQAAGEIAFLSPVGRTAGLLLGPLAIVGMWRLARNRRWWILAAYGFAACLYLAAAWLPVLSARSFLVGVWYDDSTRVGALLALLGIPLAALGANVIAQRIFSWWRSGLRLRASMVGVTIAALACTHLIAIAIDLSHMRNVSFRFDAASQGLSAEEAEFFEQASRYLGPESLVIANPLTGAGLVYAYLGVDVVFPHVTGSYGPDAMLIASGLRWGGVEVCDSVHRLGVTHALDFGEVEIYPNQWPEYDGLRGLKSSPILEARLSEGSATLYEVTGCH